jgi:uncharacterized protein DUF1571
MQLMPQILRRWNWHASSSGLTKLTKPSGTFPHVVRHLRRNPHGHNTLGSVVVSCALGLLYFHAQPTTAGTDPGQSNSEKLLENAATLLADDATSGDDDDAGVSGDKSETTVAAHDTPKLTGKEALLESDRILAEAQLSLEKTSGYSATFIKQERIGDALTDLQVIQLRLYHQPMRVLMKWEGGKDSGQRVLFADGENDGEMLVRKMTGIESRLGVIALNPSGAIALKYSRYPVTKVGLLELVKITRQHRAKDLKAESGVTATMLERQKFDGRECLCFVIEYAKPEASPDDKQEYRKTTIYIDSKTKLPICVRCYGWPDKVRGADPQMLDQTTLLEFYAYQKIDLEAQVKLDDFSQTKLQ